MIPEDDFRKLKIQVFECMKRLKGSGGPSASRFHVKLSKLIDGIENCQQNKLTLTNNIKTTEAKLNKTNCEFVNINEKIKEAQDDIKVTREAVERKEKLSSQQDHETKIRNSQIAQIEKENEEFQIKIKAGPGWSASQIQERDTIIKQIKEERSSLNESSENLEDVKKEISSTETKIKDTDRLRDQVMVELNHTKDIIEASNKSYLETQKQLHDFDHQSEMLKLNLSQEQEELDSSKSGYKREAMKRQMAEERLNETYADIDLYSRKVKEAARKRDKLISELGKQKDKNKQIDVQNTAKVCQIREKKKQIETLSAETRMFIQKKDIISKKIVEAEKERVELEQKRDELKMQMNKIVHVEMNAKKRESETQKRQKEALKREIDLLDRKKDLSQKSSDVVMDLLRSSETTATTLHHDLMALKTKSKEYQKKMKHLMDENEKDRQETELASQKIKDALSKLNGEERTIQNSQKELESTEVLLKQKQHMCEALKNECNTRSKALVANHEEIEKAKKDYNVVDRQINQIKIDISHTEDELVIEHFNHHQANGDRDVLHTELEQIRKQSSEVDRVLDGHKKELVILHQSIQCKDSECDKFVKEYITIIGYRDSIGTILLRKNEELEKIQEKIKIQQSMLHHSEVDYQEQMLMITNLIEKLKELSSQKKALVEEARIYDEHAIRCNHLETDVQQEKSKNMALKEELGRPFNVHRWRTLEHRNPLKFEKIQKVQKLQRRVIETADMIATKERSIRDIELLYLQTKRVADRQPQLTEISQQLNIYQSALDEKNTQMSNIDVDLNLMKKKVEDLRKTLKDLEIERKQMKSKWLDSVVAEH